MTASLVISSIQCNGNQILEFIRIVTHRTRAYRPAVYTGWLSTWTLGFQSTNPPNSPNPDFWFQLNLNIQNAADRLTFNAGGLSTSQFWFQSTDFTHIYARDLLSSKHLYSAHRDITLTLSVSANLIRGFIKPLQASLTTAISDNRFLNTRTLVVTMKLAQRKLHTTKD